MEKSSSIKKILRTNKQFYDEVIEDYLHFEFEILFIQSNENIFE